MSEGPACDAGPGSCGCSGGNAPRARCVAWGWDRERSELHLPHGRQTPRGRHRGPFSAAANGGHVLTAVLNRQNCLLLKDCLCQPHSEWPRAALAFPPHNAQGKEEVTELRRLAWTSTVPGRPGESGLCRSWGRSWALLSTPLHSVGQGVSTRQRLAPAPPGLASTLASRCPRKPRLSGKRKAAAS